MLDIGRIYVEFVKDCSVRNCNMQEQASRYYFYDPNWSDNEEAFELINGCGSRRSGCNSHMMILFCPDGCVINGFDNCSYDDEIYYTFDDDGDIQWCKSVEKEKKNALKMKEIVQGLPDVFHEFVEKSLESIRSTFCIWKTKDGKWSRSGLGWNTGRWFSRNA